MARTVEITGMSDFAIAVLMAESLPDVGSNGGGTRGYPLSVWYGDGQDGDGAMFVVDYNEDGSADRAQVIGGETYHRN